MPSVSGSTSKWGRWGFSWIRGISWGRGISWSGGYQDQYATRSTTARSANGRDGARPDLTDQQNVSIEEWMVFGISYYIFHALLFLHPRTLLQLFHVA